MTTRNTIHHKLEIVSRVRLTVNDVPTHRTHTQVTTKVTILQSHTQSVSITVDSTSTQVERVMTHVATTRSWATTSSQGKDTQPENNQPAGGTRHQRPHVRHDHGSNDDGEHDVETRTATVLLTGARNSSEHEQGWLRDTRVVRNNVSEWTRHRKLSAGDSEINHCSSGHTRTTH